MSDVTLIQAIQAGAQKEDQARFETGMEVEVHQIIKDGEKERIQKFRGLIISMRGATPLTRMITVRSDVDGIGIERIIPINSPFITGKAARLKEIK
jgi:large subunit ribosomal protein L19